MERMVVSNGSLCQIATCIGILCALVIGLPVETVPGWYVNEIKSLKYSKSFAGNLYSYRGPESVLELLSGGGIAFGYPSCLL